MRPPAIAVIVSGFMLIGFVVLAGGRHLAPEAVRPDGDIELADAVAQPVVASGLAEAAERDNRIAAPPRVEFGELERVEPRAPLSQLSQALPPAPPEKDGETMLNLPRASAAGVIEAMGYTVTVPGIQIVDPSETCTSDGRTWPCGRRALTEFRSWLQGRAVTCHLPDGAASGAVEASCQRGRQDAGAWLVANGWARAAGGGPYVDEEQQARDAKRGIFGRPGGPD